MNKVQTHSFKLSLSGWLEKITSLDLGLETKSTQSGLEDIHS